MHRGYVKLWRKLKDSDMWLKDKFTRGQAWVDLIMLANYKEGHIRKRGIRIDLNRGDVGWSERELSKRWKWSRGKVRRFLSELSLENDPKLIPQTTPQNKNITSCYHICNYDLYQDVQTTNDTTNGPQTGHKRATNGTRRKNVKKEKKDKKYNIVFPEGLDLDIWAEYKKYRQNGKSKFTNYAQYLAVEKLKKFKAAGDDPNAVLQQSMLCGWSGLFPLKDNKTQKKDMWEEWLERQQKRRS